MALHIETWLILSKAKQTSDLRDSRTQPVFISSIQQCQAVVFCFFLVDTVLLLLFCCVFCYAFSLETNNKTARTGFYKPSRKLLTTVRRQLLLRKTYPASLYTLVCRGRERRQVRVVSCQITRGDGNRNRKWKVGKKILRTQLTWWLYVPTFPQLAFFPLILLASILRLISSSYSSLVFNKTMFQFSFFFKTNRVTPFWFHRDPKTNGRAHIQPAEDVYTRIRNFDSLVRAVKCFYEVHVH